MAINISAAVAQKKAEIMAELPGAAARASNELRNAALEVLGGSRSGRNSGGHTASAPGEPPAARSGTLRDSWQPCDDGMNPAIESFVPYTWLEYGSPGGMIKPRPYADKIKEMALPAIMQIYQSLGR